MHTHATVNRRSYDDDRRNELCTYKIDSLNVKHFAYYFSQIDISRRRRLRRKKWAHTGASETSSEK